MNQQLSAIRDLGGAHFDFIAGVLFNEDYTVTRAALIPYSILVAKRWPRGLAQLAAAFA